MAGLAETLCRQLDAAAGTCKPSDGPELRYWRTLKSGYLAAQVAPYAADVDAATRPVYHMAARIWLAFLTELPDGRWRLPTKAQLTRIAQTLERQTRDPPALPTAPGALDANLACILSTHGRISYTEDGTSSLLTLFEGTTSVRAINCIDLVFYANALYQWMGHTVYCVYDTQHAWLQDRPPPAHTGTTTTASQQTLGATRFYDIANPTRWMDFAEWDERAGTMYGGYCTNVFNEFGMNMYFLARATTYHRVPPVGEPRQSANYAYVRLIKSILDRILQERSLFSMPLRDLHDGMASVAMATRDVVSRDLTERKGNGYPTNVASLPPLGAAVTPLTLLEDGLAYHTNSKLSRASMVRLAGHRLFTKGLAAIASGEMATDLFELAQYHDEHGGCDGFSLVFATLVTQFEPAEMAKHFVRALVAESLASFGKRAAHHADAGRVTLREAFLFMVGVAARALLSFPSVEPPEVDRFLFYASAVRTTFNVAFGKESLECVYVGKVIDMFKATFDAYYERDGDLKPAFALPPACVEGRVQWPPSPIEMSSNSYDDPLKWSRTHARAHGHISNALF